MANLVTDSLASNLNDLDRIDQAAKQQNQPAFGGGWSTPSKYPFLAGNAGNPDWVNTEYTSIPIEVYNKDTGQVVKTYNNAIEYQKDTQVVFGGATQKPTLQSGDVLPSLASTVGSSALIGANLAGPLGAVFGAGIGAFTVGANLASSLGEAYRQFNQDPERDIELLATEQVDPETGEIIYSLDQSKLGKANSLSGDYVRGLKSIPDGDAVSWNVNGTELNVNVAPSFAASDTYKDYIEQLSGDLAGLTKENDPNDDYLKQVNAAIQSLQSQYFYEAEQAAAFKAKFPDASAAAIEVGLQNQLAGYITKDDDLSNFKMLVYDKDNQLVEVR